MKITYDRGYSYIGASFRLFGISIWRVTHVVILALPVIVVTIIDLYEQSVSIYHFSFL